MHAGPQRGYGTAPSAASAAGALPRSRSDSDSPARWPNAQQSGVVVMSSGRGTGVDVLHVQRSVTLPSLCSASAPWMHLHY